MLNRLTMNRKLLVTLLPLLAGNDQTGSSSHGCQSANV